jgi:undecaprenyl-diphosphatase
VLSRLYLGVEWFSLSLFSAVISLVWIGALGLGYRRHGPERLFLRSFTLPVIAIFVASAAIRWGIGAGLPDRPLATDRVQTIESSTWASGGYRQLPLQRIDLRGRSEDPFELQWAGQLPDITASLDAAGWKPLAPLTPGNLLLWLTTSSPIGLLPLLPQVHAGSHQQLALRREQDDEHQQVLRLWLSGWQLPTGEPIWLGQLSAQRARTFYRLLRYPVADNAALVDFSVPAPFEQRQVPANNGSRSGTLWLIGKGLNLYTAPYADADALSPQPVPLPPSPTPTTTPKPAEHG